MKTLDKYLREREEDQSKPRILGDDEGEHDQDYIDIMGHYKHKARHELPHEQAREFLDHAQNLRRNGDVSQNARTAGAYI